MRSAPRLDIDLKKILHNARMLVEQLAERGISVTGVTKATLGSTEIAKTLLQGGVSALGDSRIENIEALRLGNFQVPKYLIRSPMLSQVPRVIQQADVSFNTELEVIKRLSYWAQKFDRSHGVVLMVELGDLREGIMPEDLLGAVSETLRLKNIDFKGIGTNLACRCGVSPDAENMAALSCLVESIESTFDVPVEIVSGGNSANLQWVLNAEDTGRVNDLRLGESILLGCETLHRQPLEGLYTDAITLVAEVIESKSKPSLATGTIAQTAFGDAPKLRDRGEIMQMILAIGHQDIDPSGLVPPDGCSVMGASSDHLILESKDVGLSVGEEVVFQLNYSALVRAMTSPFVIKNVNPLGEDRN